MKNCQPSRFSLRQHVNRNILIAPKNCPTLNKCSFHINKLYRASSSTERSSLSMAICRDYCSLVVVVWFTAVNWTSIWRWWNAKPRLKLPGWAMRPPWLFKAPTLLPRVGAPDRVLTVCLLLGACCTLPSSQPDLYAVAAASNTQRLHGAITGTQVFSFNF